MSSGEDHRPIQNVLIGASQAFGPDSSFEQEPISSVLVQSVFDEDLDGQLRWVQGGGTWTATKSRGWFLWSRFSGSF